MTLLLYLLLIVIGVAGLAVTIAAGTKGAIGSISVDRRTGIVISGMTFVLWGLIAISSFEITVYSGGVTATESFPEIAWLAVVGASAALYSLFQASIEEVRATGGL